MREVEEMSGGKSIRVLLIEDNPGDARLMQEMLSEVRGIPFDLECAERLSAGLARLGQTDIDVVLLDLALPDSRGFGTFARTHAQAPRVPIIVLTGLDDEELAVKAVREGAQDYLVKGQLDSNLLGRAIRYAIERKRAEEALRRYAGELETLYAATSAVSSFMDPDSLLSAVLDVVLTVMDSEIGWVTLPGPTLDDPPHIAAWRGAPESFLAAEMAAPLSTCSACASLLAGGEAPAEPHLIAQCQRLPPEVLAEGHLHSHICVPLSSGQKALGVLNVAWRAPRPYSESDRKLMITIGRQVGMALRNAQLYRAARQVDRLQVLNELDQALAATLDPDKAAEVTLHRMAAALKAPMGMLFVLSPQADDHLVQTFTLAQGWIEVRASEKDLRHLQALLQRLQDGRKAILLSGEELTTFGGHGGLDLRLGSNGLLIPIWGDEGLVAMMILGGRLADHPFTDEDRALAQAAAGRAGQAIQNARLYQASQERLAHLTTLNAISTAAVSSLDLDTVLRQILTLICQALDAADGSILLSEPETGGVVFVLTLEDKANVLCGQYLPPGQGIVGWVTQHGQAVRVNAVRQDERFYEGIDVVTGSETRSLLCAPLRHRGAVTGVITLINKREGQFTDEDLSLLEAVSAITAVALENTRLYTATLARAEELELLNEIGLALTSTLDYSRVVHAALSQVQRLFQAENVSLLRPDPQTGELHFVRTLAGTTPLEVPVRLQSGEGIAGWTLEHRQPVLVRDAQNDSRFSDRVDQHLGGQTRALVAVPLLMQERAIGVIEVVSNEPGVYTLDDLRTLQALASTLAVALENAHLYDELKTLLRERERTQAQLIHSEKMFALGRLVASIAHEINNPLQSVQGCLTLAEEELDGRQRREKLDRYLDIAGSEIERISDIVRRMRDFYRPARDGMQPIDLHLVLESVLALTGKQLQHSQVTVERQWPAELPVIQANPDHLKQVFLNLVLNAIDAMPEGGTLHIRTGLDQFQSPDGKQALPAVRIDFTDTGEGMSSKVLSRLFEPFFTTKEQGSGLGLSISYNIIKSHSGQITATSQVGQGTTFTILLPMEQSEV